jgi:hypothetical protein
MAAGGGGDIEVIFNADDRDVANSLDRLASKAGGFAGEWSKATNKIKEQFTGFKNIGPAVGMALGAAFTAAGKSVLDYADKNDLVKGQLDDLKRAFNETWTAIGRDIASDGTGNMAEYIRTTERARQATVDFIAAGIGIFNDDMPGVFAAMKTGEQQTKEAKDLRNIKAETLRLESELLAASGNNVGAARNRARAERDATLSRINEMGLTDGPEKTRLLGLVDEKLRIDMQKAREADAKAKQQEFDRQWAENGRLDAADRAKREKADDDARRRAEAKQNLDFELQAAAIDAVRGTATKDEIKAMESRLELARKIAEVNRNDLLSTQDKQAAAEKLTALSGVELAGALGSQKEARYTSIEAGVNASVASVSAAARGTNPMMTVAVKSLAVHERTARAVEKLAADGVPAKLG